MSKILFISMCLPFENARNAGAKTFNFYINSFANDPQNEIVLISKVLPDEEAYLHSINKKIQIYTVSTPKNPIKKYFCYLKSLNSKINPYYKYGNMLSYEIYSQIRKILINLNNIGYEPDIVIMEWTTITLFIDQIKSIFPKAKFVASEHDVTFLGLERKYQSEKSFFYKILKKSIYENMKKRELRALLKCDLVVPHNDKDKEILVQNGIDIKKINTIVPYYDKFYVIRDKVVSNDILFYGAMNRIENSQSAIWFIENVMTLLKGHNFRFVIIGNKPPANLLKLANDEIIVTGFVDDPSTFFAKGLCLVAPLVLGAGIKVKILEAMSSGIPVLTNNIGIEGIPAKDGHDYIHCESPDEYANAIIKLYSGDIDRHQLSDNAMKFINNEFDIVASYAKYSNRIQELLRGKA